MSNRVFLLSILLLFFALTQVVYWGKIGFDMILLREGLYLATPLFAILAGIFAIQTFGLKNKRSITFLLLTAGMTYLFIGEGLFYYYEYILHIDPFPSTADFFYLLAYPCLFLGLLHELKTAKVKWVGHDKPTLFLFSLVALLFAVIIGYFGIYQAYDASESWLYNSVAMSYGIGDLFLILANVLLLILTWEFRGGKLSRVWFMLFISFVCMLIADILFAAYTTQYTKQEWLIKSLLDSLWMFSYLLFGYALFELRFSLHDTYQSIVTKMKERKTESSQNYGSTNK